MDIPSHATFFSQSVFYFKICSWHRFQRSSGKLHFYVPRICLSKICPSIKCRGAQWTTASFDFHQMAVHKRTTMLAHCNLKQNTWLCSKQSSFFSFYALPFGGKSKDAVVHWSLFKGKKYCERLEILNGKTALNRLEWSCAPLRHLHFDGRSFGVKEKFEKLVSTFLFQFHLRLTRTEFRDLQRLISTTGAGVTSWLDYFSIFGYLNN